MNGRATTWGVCKAYVFLCHRIQIHFTLWEIWTLVQPRTYNWGSRHLLPGEGSGIKWDVEFFFFQFLQVCGILLLFWEKTGWVVNFGRPFEGLKIVRFSFRKNLVKVQVPYCILVILACRKFSRISKNSRNSRKFPARENLLFYSILSFASEVGSPTNHLGLWAATRHGARDA